MNLLPVPESHLATIWLLERDFFVFMPLWRGDFPAHPLLSGRSPSRHEHGGKHIARFGYAALAVASGLAVLACAVLR